MVDHVQLTTLLQFELESFDAAYEIEATCHSPDRARTFAQVASCLKKGGLFTGYEWVMLPERGYDANNPEHVRIKEGIEVGNGLPTLLAGKDIQDALEVSVKIPGARQAQTRRG